MNLAFTQPEVFAGSGFPRDELGHAYVAESGPTWATGPQLKGKRISEFSLDASAALVSGPTPLVEYTGIGKATVAGLAAGPDGLYFSELYKDTRYTSAIDRGARILRVKYVGPSAAVIHPIPGVIQAEDFNNGGEGVAYHDSTSGNRGEAYRESDVDIETSADAGGGFDVAWTTAGEWLAYGVDVAQSGSYLLECRVASRGAGGTFHVDVSGINVSGSMSIPDTGDWQHWATVKRTVQLAAGTHTLRVVFDAVGPSGDIGNLNHLRLTRLAQTAPHPLPGTLQVEDFDRGGEGVSYHDVTPGNRGGVYRQTDVDIEPTLDAGGGYDVAWIVAGEWLAYSVNVGATATYTLEARVASNGAGGSFHVEAGGRNVSGSLVIPDTGGWQNWTTLRRTVSLAGGAQVLRLVFDAPGPGGGLGNVNYVRVVTVSQPFGGTRRALPGTLQAEDFDAGGEGSAYHDTTPGNAGGAYRQTNVDLEATLDTGGGHDVAWVARGEWLGYSVNISTAGAYGLLARVASRGGGGSFHVDVNGRNVTGAVVVPDTGGWQHWVTLRRAVTLPAGQQVLRVVFDAPGPDGGIANLNWVTVQR